MRIRHYGPADGPDWLRMRCELWPQHTAAEHEAGMSDWIARDDAAVFIAERPDRTVCGFVETGARKYADGCETSPVGYVEGWYVDVDMRRSGVGRGLLEAAEAWARRAGYTEMASDALLDNTVSHRAHKAVGYQEVERQIVYRKAL